MLNNQKRNGKNVLVKAQAGVKKIACLVVNGPAAGGVYDAKPDEISFIYKQEKFGSIVLPNPIHHQYDAQTITGEKIGYRVFALKGTSPDQMIKDLLTLAFHRGNLPNENVQ